MRGYLNLAFRHFGVKEITGEKDNPIIVKYFDDLGFNGSQLKDETAWCSAFANWICKEYGAKYSGKLNARSWLKVGTKIENPEVGDVVVFWRQSRESWKGHVGFFINESNDYIYVLGGNQSNQVSIKPYPKSRLLEYRKVT